MEESFPKISAFVITYNSEPFIKECIDSILAQQYSNLEIVVGDDGSTDGTPQILTEYKKQYPDLFKLILHPYNTGITANCNRVLRECTGDYIALLGGDDIWLPGKLFKQIEWFKQNPEKAVCLTLTEVFDHETREVISIAPDISNVNYDKDSIIDQTFSIAQSESSVLINRKFIPEKGFNIAIPHVSDFIFFMEILHKSKMGLLEEVLGKYRRHSNNISKLNEKLWIELLLSYNVLGMLIPDMAAEFRQKKQSIIYDLVLNNSEEQKQLEQKILDTLKIKEIIKYLFKRLLLKLK